MLHKTTTVLIFAFIITFSHQCFSQDDHDHNWYFNNSKSLSELWELDDEHQRGRPLIGKFITQNVQDHLEN